MLVKITTVATSAAGKQFGRDILGRPFFPQDQNIQLEQGHYAFLSKTMQTKTTDDAGELVDLAVPVERLIATATFATKQEAIEAAAEAGTMEMQVQAAVVKEAKELGLTPEAIKELANAW